MQDWTKYFRARQLLERALGTPVARCLFVFARRRRAVEREVDDLPAAIAAVERRVAELS